MKLESKVADLNGLMKTLKTTASLEERNRIRLEFMMKLVMEYREVSYFLRLLCCR